MPISTMIRILCDDQCCRVEEQAQRQDISIRPRQLRLAVPGLAPHCNLSSHWLAGFLGLCAAHSSKPSGTPFHSLPVVLSTFPPFILSSPYLRHCTNSSHSGHADIVESDYDLLELLGDLFRDRSSRSWAFDPPLPSSSHTIGANRPSRRGAHAISHRESAAPRASTRASDSTTSPMQH